MLKYIIKKVDLKVCLVVFSKIIFIQAVETFGFHPRFDLASILTF